MVVSDLKQELQGKIDSQNHLSSTATELERIAREMPDQDSFYQSQESILIFLITMNPVDARVC